MKEQVDLIGEKFGKLTVLQFSHISNKNYYWKCRCDCGKEKLIQRQHLMSSKTKSCGCLNNSSGKNNVLFGGCEEISMSYFSHKRLSAKKRKLDFSVSIKYIWDLFLKQNRKCKLTGLILTFSKNHKDRSSTTASLDRIDSSKGYIEGNVQWVHKDVNTMKWDFDQRYFVEMCKMISQTYSGGSENLCAGTTPPSIGDSPKNYSRGVLPSPVWAQKVSR